MSAPSAGRYHSPDWPDDGTQGSGSENDTSHPEDGSDVDLPFASTRNLGNIPIQLANNQSRNAGNK